MSYNELPSALKPCFLHLARFPKAYESPKRRLLQLWLAEGFVQLSPDEASVSIEDKAKIYLEELVSRTMIEIATRKSHQDGVFNKPTSDLNGALILSVPRIPRIVAWKSSLALGNWNSRAI
ncbi:hypothetical protein SO802_008082 [Lithocarpus litseifolius]|uniref:Disease resistance protein winged helix domain-containing protein n=1 Tax=Lithocarpus litseifolius TaxID=425828 RepID=A0AAW2DBH6_9ROSI